MPPFNVQPIKIKIPQKEIDHYLQVLRLARLPEAPIIPGAEEDRTYGTTLADLRGVKKTFLNLHWRKLEAEMNKWNHFTVEIEATKIHFVHQKSPRPDAIPLLILHGWPFTIFEYKYLIEPLSNPPPGQPAFHVVLPSLPGIFLSSVVPDKAHSTPDVARIMNTLMVDVLGYKIYGAHGGDFGAINLRQTQLNHPDTCRLIHFIGFPAPRPADFKDEDFATLDPADQRALARQMAFHQYSFGYFQMQTTEASTIGYALYDSPALISWLVPKYRGILETSNCPKDRREQVWMDQLVNILLYQYTHSAHTSVLMYRQSGLKYTIDGFGKDPTGKGCPMGVSSYEGEIIISPRPWVAEGGNLIWWKHHPEGGGHIPALIYPELLISDIRELFSSHWTRCAFPSKL